MPISDCITRGASEASEARGAREAQEEDSRKKSMRA